MSGWPPPGGPAPRRGLPVVASPGLAGLLCYTSLADGEAAKDATARGEVQGGLHRLAWKQLRRNCIGRSC